MGLRIFDISTPASPIPLGFCDISLVYHPQSVYVSGEYAYVGGTESIRVINVSDPNKPYEAGSCAVESDAWGVYVSGFYAYVTYHSTGLRIYEYGEFPGTAENPDPIPLELNITFNSLNYHFPGKAHLSLFSVDGRMILEESLEGSGTWVVPSFLPHGVYLARLKGENNATQAKLVVLK